jgi:hypothetical protein
MPSNLAQCQQGLLLAPGVEWLNMHAMVAARWIKE